MTRAMDNATEYISSRSKAHSSKGAAKNLVMPMMKNKLRFTMDDYQYHHTVSPQIKRSTGKVTGVRTVSACVLEAK